jgi:hypothetical protein
MQCKYHPNREAKQYCASCGIPLCDDCAEEQKSGKYFCFQCAMLRSVSEVGTSLKDKRERSAKKKEAKERKRWGAFQYFLMASGVLILSMWGYIIFGSQEVPASKVDFSNQPRILLFMVDGALKRFAYYEGNRYPEKITDLIPKYLNISRDDLPHLNLLSYRRDSKVGYLLSLKNLRGPGINILISPQGIQYETPPGERG